VRKLFFAPAPKNDFQTPEQAYLRKEPDMNQALRTFEPGTIPGYSFEKQAVSGPETVYPDSDGKPMADNTKQFSWIVKIKEGLEVMFADDPDVFVAGDLLWYPVKGNRKISAAPDAMVVFGRPKGHRGSYRQWKEGNIVPQVVFEILSPGNTPKEMKKKFGFYRRHGVEEYYLYDPDRIIFKGWTRSGRRLQPVPETQGWVSPRVGIRFEIIRGELEIFRPDGRKFLSFLETDAKAEQERQLKEQERQRADQAEAKVEMLEAKLKALELL